MPTEDIKLIDKYIEVRYPGAVMHLFYSVPSSALAMYDIASRKKSGLIPKILRVSMSYAVEYVRPTAGTVAGGSINILDCNGNDVTVASFNLPWYSNKVNDTIDLSQYFMCTAPALGVNAAKVVLFSAQGLPIPITGYNIKIVMHWEWGW